MIGRHARLRHALYMATITAVRCNPVIQKSYKRMVAQGKPKKVALIAAARKLLHICWACVKYERTFDPDYGRNGVS